MRLFSEIAAVEFVILSGLEPILLFETIHGVKVNLGTTEIETVFLVRVNRVTISRKKFQCLLIQCPFSGPSNILKVN